MTRPARLKALSLLLILSLLLHCFPALPVVAEEPAPSDTALPATEPAQPLTEQCRILDHVDADVFASGNHVARLPEEEQLYSYVFQNADGSKTVYYMDQAVKFVDANGIIQEKNLTLTAVASDLTPNAMGITPTAGYTTACNDVGLYLPVSPADGIRLNYGAKYVTVIPQGGDSGVTASVDGGSIVYRDYYGPGMSLVYTPSLSGVKEDIVLSAYTGVTAFTFTLRTNGLNLYQANGRYFLAASKTATERFDLGDVVAFDANGRFSVGSMTVKTVMPGQAYAITLSVSEEYLTAPDTVYPVRIDPTITVNSANNAAVIEDASIYQLMPTTNANWPFMHCGYYSTAYGIGRIMVRLTGLLSDSTYQTLTPDLIQSATFHIREATGKAAHTIQLRAHTGNNWTESGATWNSVGTSLGPVYATASVGPNTMAQFDIKQLVIDWIEEERIDTKGFVLTHSDEDNATKGFCSSEYTTTGYRPYVTVTYTDQPTQAPSLSNTVLNLRVPEEYTIRVNNAPGTVTWSSSNTDIAYIEVNGDNSCTIFSGGAGTATVTASVGGYTFSCTVHILISDGFYRIRNKSTNTYLAMKDGQIGSASRAIVGNYSTNSVQYLGQLWKITYIGNGEYSFRSLLHEEFALNANSASNYVNLTRAREDVALNSYARWHLSCDSSEFVITNDASSYVLSSPATGNQVTLAQVAGGYHKQQWYLEKVTPNSIPVVIMFFDTATGRLNISSYATDELTYEVEMGYTKLFSSLGLEMSICNKASGNTLEWSSSDENVVSIAQSGSGVTPSARGDAEITVTLTAGTITRTIRFMFHSIETISVRNLFDDTLTQDQINSIDDAVVFLNTVYYDEFNLKFVMDEIFIRYSDAPIHQCQGGSTGECNGINDGCGYDCSEHHKNVHRLANEIYDDHYSSNTLPVFWSNSEYGIYCYEDEDEDGNTYHLNLNALGVVAGEETNAGTANIPVVMMLTINEYGSLNGSCDDISLMSIVLAHEVAHTLGLREVYKDYYGTKDIHEPIYVDEQPDGKMPCIMSEAIISDLDGFMERLSTGEVPLCNSCVGILHSIISSDVYLNAS